MSHEEIILDVVKETPGIKGTHLVSEVISRLYKSTGNIVEINLLEVIEKLVSNKQILEIEYVAPDMDYRVKSLYFPAGISIFMTSRECEGGKSVS